MNKLKKYVAGFLDYDGIYEVAEGDGIMIIEADDLFLFDDACEQFKYALAACDKIEIVPSEKHELGLTIRFYPTER